MSLFALFLANRRKVCYYSIISKIHFEKRVWFLGLNCFISVETKYIRHLEPSKLVWTKSSEEKGTSFSPSRRGKPTVDIRLSE